MIESIALKADTVKAHAACISRLHTTLGYSSGLQRGLGGVVTGTAFCSLMLTSSQSRSGGRREGCAAKPVLWGPAFHREPGWLEHCWNPGIALPDGMRRSRRPEGR